jgi:hypothetical protein
MFQTAAFRFINTIRRGGSRTHELPDVMTAIPGRQEPIQRL